MKTKSENFKEWSTEPGWKDRIRKMVYKSPYANNICHVGFIRHQTTDAMFVEVVSFADHRKSAFLNFIDDAGGIFCYITNGNIHPEDEICLDGGDNNSLQYIINSFLGNPEKYINMTTNLL